MNLQGRKWKLKIYLCNKFHELYWITAFEVGKSNIFFLLFKINYRILKKKNKHYFANTWNTGKVFRVKYSKNKLGIRPKSCIYLKNLSVKSHEMRVGRGKTTKCRNTHYQFSGKKRVGENFYEIWIIWSQTRKLFVRFGFWTL